MGVASLGSGELFKVGQLLRSACCRGRSFFFSSRDRNWVVVGQARRVTAWIDRLDRGRSGRRWLWCGRTSTSPCQVSKHRCSSKEKELPC